MKIEKHRVEPRGLGDDLKKIFEKTGVAPVFKIIQNTLKIEDCGCRKRQEWLNKKFPYEHKEL